MTQFERINNCCYFVAVFSSFDWNMVRWISSKIFAHNRTMVAFFRKYTQLCIYLPEAKEQRIDYSGWGHWLTETGLFAYVMLWYNWNTNTFAFSRNCTENIDKSHIIAFARSFSLLAYGFLYSFLFIQFGPSAQTHSRTAFMLQLNHISMWISTWISIQNVLSKMIANDKSTFCVAVYFRVYFIRNFNNKRIEITNRIPFSFFWYSLFIGE